MNKKTRPVIFGEVLFDTFPDGQRVLGGAPFNVAWHCQAFGLDPLFISRVGKDEQGRQVVSAMQSWGMDVSGVQYDTDHPTGIVAVKFIENQPAYDIVENSAWDFVNVDDISIPEPGGVLYHGSLALRSEQNRDALSAIRQTLQAPVFVDVNLRKPWWHQQDIHEIIGMSSWLKLNDEELDLLIPGALSQRKKMQQLMDDTSLQKLIVTLGADGLIAVDDNGNDYRVSPEKRTEVIDTVGAGDSFSSILLLGYYMNWPFLETLERAQKFASAIVGIRGATTQTKTFYQPFINEWQL